MQGEVSLDAFEAIQSLLLLVLGLQVSQGVFWVFHGVSVFGQEGVVELVDYLASVPFS